MRVAVLVALSCGCAGGAPPASRGLVQTESATALREPVRPEVPVRSRFEVAFDVPGGDRAPDDVRIEARFTSPSGAVLVSDGFASHGRWRVRFTPRDIGPHAYVVRADAGAGMREVARGELLATPSNAAGFVRIDPRDHHRLVRDDGARVYVLGENRINVYDPTWNYERADIPTYLARMASYGMHTIRVFVFADCESETTPGGYQIGCLEPRIGRFDERTADAFDVLFDAAERNGIDVVLVAFAIGFTPGPETWRSWNDNPYSAARGGPARTPEDFFTSPALRANASRKLRYIAARWGASPRLLAIDLLNEPEWDGPIPETVWMPWADAMSDAWRSFDPYRHLVTTGSVGLHSNIGASDERPWYANPKDDVVQWHLYGKKFYPPHALAMEMTRLVDETYGFGKPVVCGEFGYGGEDKATFDHTHDGIWSLVFSGAGALVHTAPPFEIDSDEPMTPGRGAHFRVLSDLLRSFGDAGMSPRKDVRVLRSAAHAWTIASDDATMRGVWLLGPEHGYGDRVSDVELSIPAPPAGPYALTWLDDVTGAVVGQSHPASNGQSPLVVKPPPFVRHIAAKLVRE